MVNIFQNPLMTNFLYPMLFMFVLLFAVLEKLEIFGKGKTQSNAILSLVASLIFVGFVVPRTMVTNLVLFMAIGLFVIFVVLLLWGFVSGNKDLSVTDGSGKKIHSFFAVLIFGSVTFVILWFSGLGPKISIGMVSFFEKLSNSSWAPSFFGNLALVLILLTIVFIVVGFNPFGKKANPWISLGK